MEHSTYKAASRLALILALGGCMETGSIKTPAQASDGAAGQGASTEAEVAQVSSALTTPFYITTRGCNQTQKNEIFEAAVMAQDRLAQAVTGPYLNQSTPEYTRWFGAYDGDRANTVKTGMLWIYTELADNFYIYDCAPDADRCPTGTTSTLAEVDVDIFSDLDTIYLCPVFFKRAGDRKSQAATFVHEYSHLLPVPFGATDDIVYQSGPSMNLANTNPDDAIENADNWGYFSEEMALHEPIISSSAWGTNHLDAVSRSLDGTVQHMQWNGSAWVAFESLGGAATSAPKMVSWGPNRMDVFVRGEDQAYWHKSSDGTKWYPNQTDWEGLGGTFISPPSVVSWGANRLDIFGIGADGGMWHKAWNGSAWSPSKTGWENLGGAFQSISPAVVSWGTNAITILAIGGDNQMYMKSWIESAWSPAGKDWTPLGGKFLGLPTAVSLGTNRLDIFGRGTNGGLFHKGFDGLKWSPSGTGWQNLGNTLLGSPVAVKTHASRIDVLGIDNGGSLSTISWDDTLRQWSSWQVIGSTGSSGAAGLATPSAVSWGPKRIDVFVPDGNLNTQHKYWDVSAWFPTQQGFENLSSLGGKLSY